MRKFLAIATGALAIAVASPALAQNARSFVSAQGNDANSCSLATPCRTLQRAHNQTNAGGEIDVLDTAGYGSLTITKAISIVNDGSVASVLVPSGGTGITINAGVNDAVSLRGLTIEGGGSGTKGVVFNSGASLTVENCVIRHVTLDGIAFFPNATSRLSVSNSSSSDNGQNGINILPTGSGAVTAVLNRVETKNNPNIGIAIEGDNSTGTLKVTVSESIVVGNGAGVFVITTSGKASTTSTVTHSVIADNAGSGLSSGGLGATIRVANSTVTGNASGWSVNTSGILQSYGNNSIDGNAGFETPPPSVALK